MVGSRIALRTVLAGFVLAVMAMLLGSAGAAAVAPAGYPPAPSADRGAIVVDGDTITACGPAGATDPGAPYTVDVDGAVVASGSTLGDGSYCVTAKVPSGLAAGTHRATFTSTKNGTSFTLSTSFLRAGGAELPRTGADTAGTVRLAIVLASAGALLLAMLTVRRRSQNKA